RHSGESGSRTKACDGFRCRSRVWQNRGIGAIQNAYGSNVQNVLHGRHKMCYQRRVRQGAMPRTSILKRSFFARPVLEVARDLIGATLMVGGCGGRIVEVEAYHHTEPAAHSYGGMTPRNAVMFGPPGFVYVYRSYGIHWCMNFVCEEEGSASAVLLRAIEPRAGLAAMQKRRGLTDARLLCAGPGRLCEAMGVTIAHNGLPLDRAPFRLRKAATPPEIVIGRRIGITKAVEN